MPSRIIREGILGSDRVNRLSLEAELFYRRLMSVVDDYGRFDGRPVLLRASCYRLRLDDVSEADILKYLTECETNDLIRMYAQNGEPQTIPIRASDLDNVLKDRNLRPFLEYVDFRQKVRAKESKFPDPPPPGGCGSPALHPYRTCPDIAEQPTTMDHADDALLRPEAEAYSRTEASTGGSEADGRPPTAGEKNPQQPPAEKTVGKKHFRGQPVPSPDRLDADYDRVPIPRLEEKDDAYSITDPIVLAMAVTDDKAKQSWLGWVSLLKKARDQIGRTKADRLWMNECHTFLAELCAGESVSNPGAALTSRLQKTLVVKNSQ